VSGEEECLRFFFNCFFYFRRAFTIAFESVFGSPCHFLVSKYSFFLIFLEFFFIFYSCDEDEFTALDPE
jgi:hypothetical protein